MNKLKSGVILNESEKLVVELEAELWASSSNPIAKFIGACWRIISLIFGIKKKGFVVVTNKRIIEVRQDIACWVFNTAKEIKYVLPSSVKEVGYIKEGTFLGCFCQAYHLYYDAFTQRTSVQLKGFNEQQTQALVDTVYATISQAQIGNYRNMEEATKGTNSDTASKSQIHTEQYARNGETVKRSNAPMMQKNDMVSEPTVKKTNQAEETSRRFNDDMPAI